jgi:hypothetical protein
MQNNFRMRTPLTRTLAHPRPPARAWEFKSCTAATSNRARIAKGHTESVGRSVPRNAQVSPLRLGTGCFFAADAGSGTAQGRAPRRRAFKQGFLTTDGLSGAASHRTTTEPTVWLSLRVCVFRRLSRQCVFMCVLLQDLVQSCLRGIPTETVFSSR